jgi:dipeptidyl aminopeptidase/acylaminoacyl peptidase
LLRQLSTGPYNVAGIAHVDEDERWLYFTALGREEGRDPYYPHLYRVRLDGSAPELLTPEDAAHTVWFSPSGKFFVDTYSRLDLPTVSLVRSASGAEICELERADVGALLETGWQPPERFCAKARDGVTEVYGAIFRPSRFDANRRYPLIDNIYGGPQVNQAPTTFADAAPFGGPWRAGRGRGFWHAQALAELGFVVVMIDGLGMPGRGKSYADVSYRNLADGGLPDHIAVLRQLADRYPYLDLSRVGIFGHSAGGYASTRAIFTYPDFYKVCVSSAGNHDHRLDKAVWVERYMGLPVGKHYEEQANQALAHQLKGKLLLIHPEMDENVHPASTMVVVDALIKANKDFDLLILPNLPHFCDSDPYFVRKRWDYFVRHLLGAEPPAGYRIEPATPADIPARV